MLVGLPQPRYPSITDNSTMLARFFVLVLVLVQFDEWRALVLLGAGNGGTENRVNTNVLRVRA